MTERSTYCLTLLYIRHNFKSQKIASHAVKMYIYNMTDQCQITKTTVRFFSFKNDHKCLSVSIYCYS